MSRTPQRLNEIAHDINAVVAALPRKRWKEAHRLTAAAGHLAAIAGELFQQDQQAEELAALSRPSAPGSPWSASTSGDALLSAVNLQLQELLRRLPSEPAPRVQDLASSSPDSTPTA